MQKNRVGLLQQFHDREGGAPVYRKYAFGKGFGCTCTVALYPDYSFGSGSECFGTKEAARANAAAEAMKYLMKEGLTNLDGSMKPKQKSATYAQRVDDLFGLNPPTDQL